MCELAVLQTILGNQISQSVQIDQSGQIANFEQTHLHLYSTKRSVLYGKSDSSSMYWYTNAVDCLHYQGPVAGQS